MEGKLHKANQLSNALNGWGKIVAFIVCLIGGAYITYYQIQTNSAAVIELRTLIDDHEVTMKREFEIWGDRSDKRYNRATKMADGINDRISGIQSIQVTILQKLSYIEGKLEKYEN